MPYILSPLITYNSPGMWNEGAAYLKNNIYSIEGNKLPPVNYDEHIIRPHSLTHVETPAHTQKDGKKLDDFYRNNLDCFFGKTLLIKIPGNKYAPLGNGIYHWEVSLSEILVRIQDLNIELPPKLLISTEFCPLNDQGYHDPNYVLTISQEAADFLVSNSNFNLFGTSWKSSDYNPKSSGRPIHNTLFKKALIVENLVLNDVPEGVYFLSAFPIPLQDASESPVVPVLFTKNEILSIF